MHDKSIELLNGVVADELSAIHQYMYFHFHCDDQGFDLLAQLFKRTAIEEMLHVERLAERILFLKGDVDMTVTDATKPITDVQKMLETAAGTAAAAAPQWRSSCVRQPGLYATLQAAKATQRFWPSVRCCPKLRPTCFDIRYAITINTARITQCAP